MSYEAGFRDGELQAFKDRKAGHKRILGEVKTEYQRGYQDGYTPRNLAWALTKPAAQWWLDNESDR
jgi:hypothetical protein